MPRRTLTPNGRLAAVVKWRQSAAVLAIRQLLALELETPGPALSASCGVMRASGRLFVLAREGAFVARFDEGGRGRIARQLDASDQALISVPPSSRFTHGAALALATGASGPARAVAWALEQNGDFGPDRSFDLELLYAFLRSQLNGLELRGGGVAGSVLRAVHRGAAPSEHAMVDLDFAVVSEAIEHGGEVRLTAVKQIRPLELGQLSPTSAAALPGGGLVIACSGPSAAVAIVDSSGRTQIIEPLKTDRQVSGIDVAAGDGGVEVWLVLDGEGVKPAALATARLELPRGLA